ncbi:MAG: hypothetical protein LBP22_07285 [Deltaproteobacteria bacterium]|nr:hypothetical protein [Deltaproteobacteria bacterium]
MESVTVLSITNWPITHGDLQESFNLSELMMSVLGLKDDGRGFENLQQVDPQVLSNLTYFLMNKLILSPVWLFQALDDLAKKFWERFPAADSTRLDQTRQALTYSIFSAGTIRMAEMISRHTDVCLRI